MRMRMMMMMVSFVFCLLSFCLLVLDVVQKCTELFSHLYRLKFQTATESASVGKSYHFWNFGIGENWIWGENDFFGEREILGFCPKKII